MGIVVGPSCIGTKGIVVIIGDGEDARFGGIGWIGGSDGIAECGSISGFKPLRCRIGHL